MSNIDKTTFNKLKERMKAKFPIFKKAICAITKPKIV